MTSQTKRIVLVDDDDDFCAAVTAFLELHGYEVQRAADGRAGVALAEKVKPDLVLMDVMMNERTEGFFAVQTLKRTPGLEQVPVFVLSSVYGAMPEFQVPPERAWMGQDEFFTKPVDLPALLKAISARVGESVPGALATDPGTNP